MKKKINPVVFISAFVVEAIILALIGYRIYDKVNKGQTNEIWIDIVLIILSFALLARVIYIQVKATKK